MPDLNDIHSKKEKRRRQRQADAAANVAGGTLHLVLKIIGTVLLVLLCTILLFACIFAYYVKTCLSADLPLTLEDMSVSLTSSIWYTDSNGEYQELTTLHSREKREWVTLDQIPEYMQHAAVAIEDQRFYEHKGVDWYRTVGAFVNMFVGMKNDFGGSTLTQQLIKNVTEEDDVTVQRKLLEIFRALELEKNYDKDEIMEWYLNIIYLGQSAYGVQAASQVYFNKDVSDLSLAECACIIGITNNPSAYDPYVFRDNNKERQELILWEMYDQGYITKEEYDAAVAEELQFVRAEHEEYTESIYSYFEEVVIEDVLTDLVETKGITREAATRMLYYGGYQVYSTLDMNIQNIVDKYYQDPASYSFFQDYSGNQFQSAIVLIDPYNGCIRALSGGVGEKSSNFVLNRATGTQRPSGSSFKPIATYGPAVDVGLITPSTQVYDGVVKLKGTTWFPQNAGGGYRGNITILQALVNSLNTVSAQILDKLGVETSWSYLTERLGFTSLVDTDKAYAPLSLGQQTYGVTVREMAQAFSALATDGTFTYSRSYTHVLDSEGNVVLDNTPDQIAAFKPNTAYTMTYMLNQAARYGTGSEANLGSLMPTAGKTGSTTDYKDRWFVGYTPYYLAAVWTGFDTPQYMRVSGNPACRIWKAIMTEVHQGLEYKNFPDATLGGPTGVFGDMIPEVTESPTESPENPEESPSESPTDTPTDSPIDTPTDSPAPPTTTSPVVTDPPVVTDTPEITTPPSVTTPPAVDSPPPAAA